MRVLKRRPTRVHHGTGIVRSAEGELGIGYEVVDLVLYAYSDL